MAPRQGYITYAVSVWHVLFSLLLSKVVYIPIHPPSQISKEILARAAPFEKAYTINTVGFTTSSAHVHHGFRELEDGSFVSTVVKDTPIPCESLNCERFPFSGALHVCAGCHSQKWYLAQFQGHDGS